MNPRKFFIPIVVILLLGIGCDDTDTPSKQDNRHDLKQYPTFDGVVSTKTIPIFSQWDLSCGACNANDPLSNFNALAPEYGGPNPTQCGHADAGCVAVAIGQILNYWRKSDVVDWSKIKDTCSTRETAKLLNMVGKSLDMIYNVDKSGSSGIPTDSLHLIIDSFSQFGFAAEVADFDLVKALEEINLGRPLILIGCSGPFCHAWITTAYGVSKSNEYYLYMNWGLDYNSWSSAVEWNAGGTIFKDRRKMIYKIKPQ